MLQTRWFQNIFIVFLILLVSGLLWWGWGNAERAAKSKTVLKDAASLVQGFEYFYKDQNRYPSTSEFDDENLMRTYINNFPPLLFLTEVCTKTFDYYNSAPDKFSLRVCLPKAIDGYREGWNIYQQ